MKRYLEFIKESLDDFDKDLVTVKGMVEQISSDIMSSMEQFQNIQNRTPEDVKRISKENIEKSSEEKEEKEVEKTSQKFKEKLNKMVDLVDKIDLIFKEFYKNDLWNDVVAIKKKLKQFKKPDELQNIYTDVDNLEKKYDDVYKNKFSDKKEKEQFDQKIENFKKENDINKSVPELIAGLKRNIPKPQETQQDKPKEKKSEQEKTTTTTY